MKRTIRLVKIMNTVGAWVKFKTLPEYKEIEHNHSIDLNGTVVLDEKTIKKLDIKNKRKGGEIG